jgi:hypothetical protein
MTNPFLVNVSSASVSKQQLLESVPEFIKTHMELGAGGPISSTSLVKPSSHLLTWSNIIRISWQYFIFKVMDLKSAHPGDSKTSYLAELIGSKFSYENQNDSAIKLEGLVNAKIESPIHLFRVLYEGTNDNDIPSFDEWHHSALKRYLLGITACRKLSNHCRHCLEPGYQIERNNEYLIAAFINQDDMKLVIHQMTFIAAIFLTPIGELLESPQLVFDQVRTEVNEAMEIQVTDSLSIYRDRLDKLVWGPLHFVRSQSILQKAHAALVNYPIVSFYGLGGVGKTALVQKLMHDIIINREPFTHIVTSSSKVGSDQKEVNHIGSGPYGETDETVNVMDTSLFEHDGKRRIGGLRSLLRKLYREIRGVDSPDGLDDNELQRVVLKELANPRNQVLVILDNFEDIEDNIEDARVRDIKERFQKFLEDFSHIVATRSRILITTRSFPMDISHGIRINHLDKREAVDLFLMKLQFRMQRLSSSDPSLADILRNVHQTITGSPDQFDRFVELFSLWSGNDEHIAHPLLVLLAAEDVKEKGLNHLDEIISEYEKGSRAKDVINYGVSKTLGAFEEKELSVLKLLSQESHNSTDISPSYIQSIIEDAIDGTLSYDWIDGGVLAGLKSLDHEIHIDLQLHLINRTFLQESSNSRETKWNPLILPYLKDRFNKNVVENIKTPLDDMSDSLIDASSSGIDALEDWLSTQKESFRTTGRNNKILKKQLITPLKSVIDAISNDFQKRDAGRQPSFRQRSISKVLDQQSAGLLKIFSILQESIKADSRLKGFVKKKDYPIEDILSSLSMILFSHAKVWRLYASTSTDSDSRLMGTEGSLIMHECLRTSLRIFNKQALVDSESRMNILLLIGMELLEFSNLNHDPQGTQKEEMSLLQLSWLEAIGDSITPWDCELKSGLILDTKHLPFAKTWVDLFENLVDSSRNSIMDRVEGIAFWMYLRLFSTEKAQGDKRNRNLLDQFRDQGLRIRNTIPIDQYIRTVQSTYEEYVVEIQTYIEGFRNFRSQPANGTLIRSPLSFTVANGRWEHSVMDFKSNWLLVVDSEEFARKAKFPNVILKQIGFDSNKNLLTAEFLFDDNWNPLTDLSNNMQVMNQFAEHVKVFLETEVENTRKRGLNTISLHRLRRIIDRRGPGFDDAAIIRMCTELVGLTWYKHFFIIDPEGDRHQPLHEYEEYDGSEHISERISKHKLVLPRDPHIFSEMLSILYEFKKQGQPFTLQLYRVEVRRRHPNISYANGAIFIFFALGLRRFSLDWQQRELSSDDIPKWDILIEGLFHSIKSKCSELEDKHGITISQEMISAYIDDVRRNFPD